MSSKKRSEIRQLLRRQRCAISDDERAAAATGICATLVKQQSFRAAQNLAAYDCNDGEVSVWPAIRNAWDAGKNVFLPVLRPGSTLEFVEITDQTTMQLNRYGIREPAFTEIDLVPAAKLDLVLMPIVAFDRELHRLGMGKGYYDRTLAFTQSSTNKQPVLVGMAYEIQRVTSVYPQAWDIPLHQAITENRIYCKE